MSWQPWPDAGSEGNNGPYQLQILPVSITNIPEGKVAQLKIRMTQSEQEVESSKNTVVMQVRGKPCLGGSRGAWIGG